MLGGNFGRWPKFWSSQYSKPCLENFKENSGQALVFKFSVNSIHDPLYSDIYLILLIVINFLSISAPLALFVATKNVAPDEEINFCSDNIVSGIKMEFHFFFVRNNCYICNTDNFVIYLQNHKSILPSITIIRNKTSLMLINYQLVT